MKIKNIKELNKKTICKIVVVLLIGIVALWSVITLISNYQDINSLKSQYNDYKEQYEEQIAENNKLKNNLKSKNKSEYIEEKAREKGYVKDDEVVFYDVS